MAKSKKPKQQPQKQLEKELHHLLQDQQENPTPPPTAPTASAPVPSASAPATMPDKPAAAAAAAAKKPARSGKPLPTPITTPAPGSPVTAIAPAAPTADADDTDDADDAESARQLIPALCKQFYHLGWVTGTGGGISIREGDNVYIAPSGVQKERMRPDDMFVLDRTSKNVVVAPSGARGCALKQSQCTPLFFTAYDLRDAAACIHTHSQNAVMATLLYPGKEFVITHMEMIKGIRVGSTKENLKYYSRLVVPIIENTPEEEDLQERMEQALLEYPDANAVLVRRHGVYVWGETWEKAKTMTECYDYLFEMAVKMKLAGLDPTKVPEDEAFDNNGLKPEVAAKWAAEKAAKEIAKEAAKAKEATPKKADTMEVDVPASASAPAKKGKQKQLQAQKQQQQDESKKRTAAEALDEPAAAAATPATAPGMSKAARKRARKSVEAAKAASATMEAN
ncbi:methylthioribulose-1-phosphate dehydratase [Allomyces macrogynus ATCC 38327]|uniref:Methylthioribulose-1-phosphate dehydratase n=1 Tax=Allomyces macrogynus (strain ATCC 38327) TaxID=578462 RepID=A0A0L0SI81_ALLM3|nr:methylthioribulose-1-phosphate dehydratase [Allomyces macrogynus ATCC 38327]|eukprot:KNE62045.1 methylthioribulose-1-phosphate dehydratase [Allomyces macrogynus ATCC 38327]